MSALVGVAALVLAACGGDNNTTPPLAGGFRIANGISDADANGLDVTLIAAYQFNGIAFGTGSGIKNPPVGSYTARFDINGLPFTVGVQINHNEVSTLFTYGTVAAGTYSGFAAYESLGTPATSQFVVQVLHSAYTAALTAATLSYYFVAAGSGTIGTTTPKTAPFATQTPSGTLPAGSYEIIVTDGTTVIYDSGAGIGGVTLPPTGSNVLQIAALDAPGAPDGSAISLLLLDNDGGSARLLNGAH
jgi:hypothetical protein